MGKMEGYYFTFYQEYSSDGLVDVCSFEPEIHSQVSDDFKLNLSL